MPYPHRNLLDQALRVGVATLFIAIPLYPKFPIFEVPGTYVAIRLEDLLIGLLTILWLIKLISNLPIRPITQLPNYLHTKLLNYSITRSVVIFWLVGFISLLSAYLITQSIIPHIGLLHTLRRIEYMLAFFITLSTIKSWQDIRFYLELVLLTAFLVFLYGLGQKFLEFPIISTMNQEYSKGIALSIMPGGRINSTFAGHYDLAAYQVVLMCLLASLIVSTKRWTSRLWISLVTLTSFWMLLMSASRISFAAYLGSITITLWLLHKRLWIIPVIIISLISSSMAPSLFTRYAEAFRYEFMPRLASIQIPNWFPSTPVSTPALPTVTPTPPLVAVNPNEPSDLPGGEIATTPTPTPEYVASGPPPPPPPILEDRSSSIRFNAEWPRALRAFYKNPLLGTGYSSITLATDNDYLRLIGEVGLIGLFSFMLIFLAIFNKIKKFLTKPQLATHALSIGIFGGSLGLLANAMFIDVFEASKIATFYWMLLAIMVGAINIDKPEPLSPTNKK